MFVAWFRRFGGSLLFGFNYCLLCIVWHLVVLLRIVGGLLMVVYGVLVNCCLCVLLHVNSVVIVYTV